MKVFGVFDTMQFKNKNKSLKTHTERLNTASVTVSLD